MFTKKLFRLFSLCFIITLLCGIIVSKTSNAENPDSSNIFKCESFSVIVPESLTADANTLEDFTSFYNDKITIGISVTDNTLKCENITGFTESKINEFANDTLSSLTAQAGEGISATGHALTTFSKNEYPALHVTYSGSTSIDPQVYMEQYVITTVSYKYTIVLSADSASDLDNDDVRTFTSSFTTTEAPLKQVVAIKDNYLRNVLIICFATLLIAATVIFKIIKR